MDVLERIDEQVKGNPVVIYIGGELVGGCDIALELHATGELKMWMPSPATADRWRKISRPR